VVLTVNGKITFPDIFNTCHLETRVNANSKAYLSKFDLCNLKEDGSVAEAGNVTK